MERRGLDLPLLIGGATTSKQHTAVRIAPAYSQPSVYVRDASRVTGSRLRPARSGAARDPRRGEPRRPGAPPRPARRARPQAAAPVPARAGEPAPVAFDDLPEPAFLGARVVEPELETLRDYVDWQFFFHAWDLKGKFPAILERPEARELYDDAQELLDEIVRDGLLSARGVHGFWPASSDGEDIAVAADAASCASACSGSRATTATRARTARWRTTSRPPATISARSPSGSSARTSSPRASRPSTTTTARSWPRRSPTGSRRPSRSTCTRRAAAPGTSRASGAPNEELIAEGYRGIRPAFGYPGLPRPFREGQALRAARRGGPRVRADRVVRGHARRGRQRDLPAPPGGAVLLRRPRRPRPGRVLRRPQGPRAARRGALAPARTSPTSPTSGRWSRCSRPERRLS